MTDQKQDPEDSTSSPSPEQTKRMLRESAAAMVASLNRHRDDEADDDSGRLDSAPVSRAKD